MHSSILRFDEGDRVLYDPDADNWMLAGQEGEVIGFEDGQVEVDFDKYEVPWLVEPDHLTQPDDE